MLSQHLTAAFLVLYIEILYVTCNGSSSLIYVIDDTGSMKDDIRQVKIGSVLLLNDVLEAKSTEIANIVLVTFNDPDVRVIAVTNDTTELKTALKYVQIYGGGDCPEYSMAGIVAGLERSLPNSYMYVFTDASAKDYHRVRQVTDLCIKKQTQIILILTGDCGNPSSPDYRVYYDIASKCRGQVFVFEKQDVSEFLTTIRATINVKKSIVKSVTVPLNSIVTPVRFTLDDKTDFAIISTTGKNVEVAVTRDGFGPQVDTEGLMLTRSVKIFKLYNNVPGDYIAWVQGTSDVSVAIYAKTDFTFEHGFSEIAPKSLADTSKRPIADKNQHLSIKVTDPDNGVRIDQVNILSPREKVLMSIPLKHIGDDFYITDKFVSPKSPFIIQVKGTNKQTGTPIYRNSRTVIEPNEPIPEVPKKAPEVSISEGSQIAVKCDDGVVLRCRVSGYPEPTITWLAEDGTIMKSNRDVVDLPYDFISYLNIQNVTKSQYYVCRARYRRRNKSSGIQVNVMSPFEVTKELPATTNVKYEKPVTLNCGIKSDLPIKRTWYSDKTKELSVKGINLDNNSDKFVINSMNIDLQGRYGCKVWLESNPKVVMEQHTIIRIDDLSPPSITPTQNIQGNTFTASCLTTGTPKPDVTWYYAKNMRGNFIPFSDLKVKGEQFKIDNINWNHIGIYKCIAENAVGIREETFNLVEEVIFKEKAPEVSISDGSEIDVKYNRNVVLRCRVSAYPAPIITWHAEDGTIMRPISDVVDHPYDFISQFNLQNVTKSLNYVCRARNKLGNMSSGIQVNVMSPFEVTKELSETTNAKYEKPVTLNCGIKSNLPTKRTWFSDKTKELSAKGINLDNDNDKFVIDYMNIDLQGRYGCKVWLESNPKVVMEQHTILRIEDLSPPSITPTQNILGNTFTASCLTTGTPKPDVTWYYAKKLRGDFLSFRDLKVEGEQFKIGNINWNHIGTYKCIAKNAVGIREETFSLVEEAIFKEKAPEVSISEGSEIDEKYNRNVVLRCRVSAYPAPIITWHAEDGTIMRPNSEVIDHPYNFISQLNLQNVTKSLNYVCRARNKFGNMSSGIQVNVMSPFEVTKELSETTNAKYKKPVTLNCGIKSNLPTKRTWFSDKTKELSAKGINLDNDNDKFVIDSMNIDLQGRYGCKVWLESNPKIVMEQHTILRIDDLSPPSITPTQNILGNTFTASCLTTGTPKPDVTWYYAKNLRGDFLSFRDLKVEGEQFKIGNINWNHIGIYKCIAKNAVGIRKETFNLVEEAIFKEKAPEVSISEGSEIDVKYNRNIVLRCRVSAYPAPIITWHAEDGTIMRPNSDVVDHPYDFISQLNLQNVTKSLNYVCRAINKLGNMSSGIQVNVMSPFEVTKELSETTNAKYEKPVTLNCGIKSNLPTKRTWFSDKTKELSAKGINLDNDNDKVVIDSMNIDLQGRYGCKVWLESNPKIVMEQHTILRIDDLSPPSIKPTQNILGNTFTASCLTTGTPKPDVTWYYAKNLSGDFLSFRDLKVEGEQFKIGNINWNHIGIYKCIAKNAVGIRKETFSLVEEVVFKEKAPEVSISEGSEIDVIYNRNVVLRCRVSAYPAPIITWHAEDGTIMRPNSDVVDHPYDFISQLNLQNVTKSLNYVCRAINKLGNMSSGIQVNVMSPFEVTKELSETTNAKYEKPVTLNCGIKSNLPTKRTWFSDKTKELSAKGINLDNDNDKFVIDSMNIDLQGRYGCKVWLESKPKVVMEQHTILRIKDLSPPSITPTQNILGNTFTASCLTTGTPKPDVTWYYAKKLRGDFLSFRDLKVEGEQFKIGNINWNHIGTYKCIAKNAVGIREETFSLVEEAIFKEKAPEVSISEGSKIDVKYNRNVVLRCKVSAYPAPIITWHAEDGTIMRPNSDVVDLPYDFISQLNLQNVTKSLNYVCRARNKLGNKSSGIRVNVMSPFEVTTELSETTNAIYEKPVTLNCGIKSNLPIKRSWFSDKTKELSAKGIKLNNNNDKFVIDSMDIDLQGRYGCKVCLESNPEVVMEQHTILQIDDISPPSLSPTHNILDNAFTASCLTTGTPKPSVTWYYAKDIRGPFSYLGVKGEQFKIDKINRNHFGTYKCIAENAVGKREETFNLVVEERPQIITDNTKYTALVGDSVLEIQCNVTGYPEPTTVWKNNDNEILNSDSKYEVTNVGNGLYLHIKDLTLKDTNNYFCEASNNVGSASKIFETYVTDDLQNDRSMYGNTYFVYLLENHSTDIECHVLNQGAKHVKGMVKNNVRWYKNGVLTNVTGTNYLIMNANAADIGNYTCRLNKEHGSISETSVVTVGTKPTFNISYDSSIMVWSGDDPEFVDCTIKSPDDHTKVKWFYNGQITEEKGFKHPLKYEWGQYTCEVSNDFGVAKRSINVTTDGCLIKRKVDFNNNPPLITSFNIAVEIHKADYSVKKFVFMEIEQKMRIACHSPHDKNHFNIYPDEEYLIAECQGEDKFVVNDKVYKYSDIKCEKPVEVTIDRTNVTCTHDHSEIINIGFIIDAGGFMQTYSMCYDNELEVPTFAFAEISTNNLGNEIDNNKWINIPNYQGVINTDCDQKSKCCYGKEQLLNAADVSFGPPQAATFYDYNAVGVWKPCGNESRVSWQMIEENVRKVMESLNYDMEVWTGASGYEQQNIGMVPRYLWKVIDSLGAIVYVNDPHPTEKDIKCSATVETLDRLINARDEFTYLCGIDEFSNVFNIPRNSFLQIV